MRKEYRLHVFITLQVLFFLVMVPYRGNLFLPTESVFSKLILMVLSVISINACYYIVTTPFRKVNSLFFIAGFVLNLFVCYFDLYHIYYMLPIDVSILFENYTIAFERESFVVYSSLLPIKYKFVFYSQLLGFLLIVVVPEFFLNKQEMKFRKRNLSSYVLSLVFVIFIVTVPVGTVDSVTTFLKSSRYMIQYNLSIDSDELDYYPSNAGFRSKKRVIESSPYKERPNIIYLMIESFNASYIETEVNGQYVTPYLDELIKEGLYIDNFYSPTIQTSRGQFASLFSQMPSFQVKVFSGFAEQEYFSLPDALNTVGYYSYFVKAYKDASFDNTADFLLNNGFNKAFSAHDVIPKVRLDEALSRVAARQWGIEDKDFYRSLPLIMEEIDTDNPFMLVLHTVMHHTPFQEQSEDHPLIFPDPENRREEFINSTSLVDGQLGIFFEELKDLGLYDNSIIIVTGDHSFPSGHNGIVNNEIGYYEESFRTPFLLIAPGHLGEHRVHDGKFTQLDIAPTILDLAGFNDIVTNFQGTSVLRESDKNRPVYLHQPYNGKILISIRSPYKFLRRLSTGESFFYDLEKDPDELHPRSASDLPEDVYSAFEKDIIQMQLHQSRIRHGFLGLRRED